MTAISGVFADFRLVMGRKCARIVVEVPIETADAALEALGGIPQPQVSRWVAIAPLNARSQHPPRPAEEPSEVHKQPAYKEPFADKKRPVSLSQRCAMTCGEVSFRRYIEHRFSSPTLTGEQVAQAVRDICGVKSRAELDTDAKAANRWHSLELDYENWQRRAS